MPTVYFSHTETLIENMRVPAFPFWTLFHLIASIATRILMQTANQFPVVLQRVQAQENIIDVIDGWLCSCSASVNGNHEDVTYGLCSEVAAKGYIALNVPIDSGFGCVRQQSNYIFKITLFRGQCNKYISTGYPTITT